MKNTFLFACAVALLSACSGPSYYLMSAKTGAYHNQNYKVNPAAPVAAQPDDAAPLEAGTGTSPAILPPAYNQVPAQNSAPVSAPVQQHSNQAPVSAPQNQLPATEESAPVVRHQKLLKKFSPKKLFNLKTSNTRLAIIFLIVGLIVALLIHQLIGLLLIIIGIVLLIA